MNLFAQIRKVDEAKRLVFGRLAEEAVDKSEEIMDYASSKPHFIKWSEEIAKDTDGKSLGNLRAMHGKVAAGKFTQIDFNDAEKAVDVCAKVVDDQEWRKVLEGVYTGFSIGGAYVGDKKVEKVDGRDVTRYTAKPSEGSLVDRPCMHGARFFEVQKADGALAKVDFQHQPERAEDTAVIAGTPEQVDALCKLMNAEGLTLDEVLEKALPAFIKDKKKGAETSTDPDGDGDAAADTDDDGDGGKKAAKVDQAEADRLAKLDADADDSLGKLEAALTDALAKAGARNSKADTTRIAKIHDMAVELGAACGAAKAEPAADLAKAEETDKLQKLVADAVAPLQKALDSAVATIGQQAAKITKLEEQPAPTRVSLRAVAKGEDLSESDKPAEKAAPIVDDIGDAHEAAGLIKFLHGKGGAPLGLRK